MEKQYADIIIKYLSQTNKYCEALEREGLMPIEEFKKITNLLSDTEQLVNKSIVLKEPEKIE